VQNDYFAGNLKSLNEFIQNCLMKKLLIAFFITLIPILGFTQSKTSVIGTVYSVSTQKHLESVNIVNLNQVIGTSTNSKGEFKITARANDTLHFSYLGYKSVKVRVTNDWLKFGSTKIELTELALALEEVVVKKLSLTGYLAVDIAQVPIQSNFRYSISGLPTTGYEAGNNTPSAISKVLGAIFNPADFLYRMFGKKSREMRKLRKMKQDDEIRNILSTRFDREMLMVLLQVNRVDLDEIVRQCDYSRDFINTANDLQLLDAISECYEEYRVLSRKKKRI
jgi:hypothetical protein